MRLLALSFSEPLDSSPRARGLLFLALQHACPNTSRPGTTPTAASGRCAPGPIPNASDRLLRCVEDRRREKDSRSEDPVVPSVEPSEFEGKRCDDKHYPDSAIDHKVQPVGNDADEPGGMVGQGGQK